MDPEDAEKGNISQIRNKLIHNRGTQTRPGRMGPCRPLPPAGKGQALRRSWKVSWGFGAGTLVEMGEYLGLSEGLRDPVLRAAGRKGVKVGAFREKKHRTPGKLKKG